MEANRNNRIRDIVLVILFLATGGLGLLILTNNNLPEPDYAAYIDNVPAQPYVGDTLNLQAIVPVRADRYEWRINGELHPDIESTITLDALNESTEVELQVIQDETVIARTERTFTPLREENVTIQPGEESSRDERFPVGQPIELDVQLTSRAEARTIWLDADSGGFTQDGSSCQEAQSPFTVRVNQNNETSLFFCSGEETTASAVIRAEVMTEPRIAPLQIFFELPEISLLITDMRTTPIGCSVENDDRRSGETRLDVQGLKRLSFSTPPDEAKQTELFMETENVETLAISVARANADCEIVEPDSDGLYRYEINVDTSYWVFVVADDTGQDAFVNITGMSLYDLSADDEWQLQFDVSD